MAISSAATAHQTALYNLKLQKKMILNTISHFVALSFFFSLFTACSLNNINQTACENDNQCIQALGGNFTCNLSDGLCVAIDNDSEQPDTQIDTNEEIDADANDINEPDVIPSLEGLVLNEIAASGDPLDWFELYNGSDNTIDLSGFLVTDDIMAGATLVPLPNGLSINVGAYLAIHLDPSEIPIRLGGDEEFAIYDPDENLIDSADWLEGDSPNGGSFGRIPNGNGSFKRLQISTENGPNFDNPALCGDGFFAETETCDDENTIGGDGCAENCIIEPDYQCEGTPSVCVLLCGNNLVDPLEACDNDNLGGRSCATYGLCNGTLSCNDDCSSNVSECIPPPGPVVFNEISSDGGLDDTIELMNITEQQVNISNWHIIDDGGNSYYFPENTAIEPLSFLEIGKTTHLVGLGDDDAISLRNELNELIDRVDWMNGEGGIVGSTYCRIPDGQGPFQQCHPSFGESNE